MRDVLGRVEKMTTRLQIVGLLILFMGCCCTGTEGMFLPGLAPDDYSEGEPLAIYVQKLTSERSKVPFDYYSLPFCHHNGSAINPRFSVRQFLLGERTKTTGYEVNLGIEQVCKVHCTSEFSAHEIKKLRRRIVDQYKVRLTLDNLPVVMQSVPGSGRIGYPLGLAELDKVYVNNHLRFHVLYHKVPVKDVLQAAGVQDDIYYIVGFEVRPFSVKHTVPVDGKPLETCEQIESQPLLELVENEPMKITFTYDVIFKESELEWGARWGPLLNSYPGRRQIQWFAIINSSLLCLFLSTLIMLILLRTLRKDRFNSDLIGSDLDETGWKSLRRDVFRPPEQNVLLCILCGTGVQLIVIVLVTLVAALLLVVSPESRGRLLPGALVLWVLTSSIAGFSAARLHGFMDGTRMRDVALGTAFMIPGLVLAVVFAINLLFWFTRSIGGTPVLAFVLLLVVWFCVSVPLCYVGAQVGSRARSRGDPKGRYSTVRREVPPQSFFFGAPMSIAGGGLPFGVLSVELLFVLNSLWQNEIYYMFGFLFFVFVIVLAVSAETSVVVTYIKLINEDHQWWWSAFLSSGSAGLYVFLYSVYYLASHQTLDGLNIISDTVILGYMGIISVLLAVMIGSVGFLSSFWFVHVIYSGVRAD